MAGRAAMEEIDYRSGLSIALYYLGLIEMDEGNEVRAGELLSRAEELAHESGDLGFLQTIRAVRGQRTKKT